MASSAMIPGVSGNKGFGAVLRTLLPLLLAALMLLSMSGCATSSGGGPVQPGSPGTGVQQPAKQGAAGAGVQPLAPGEMRVSVIDVGQGDSILVQLPGGQNMLVDGGRREAGPQVAAYLKKCGIRRIDYLVATHPHEDHIGGLLDVLPSFDVGKVYMPHATTNTETFGRLLQLLKERGLSVTTARAGVALFREGQLQAVFVAPCGSRYDDLNNWSAVARVQYGKAVFLLAGDAQAESEQEMLASGADLRADVLKVGHHGSGSSTTREFLEKVAPRYAAISVGAGNDYGHPHQATLDRLQEASAQVLRTDQGGTVVFTTDGSQIRVDRLPPQARSGGVRGFLEGLRGRLFGA